MNVSSIINLNLFCLPTMVVFFYCVFSMKLKLIWFPLILHPSAREHGASYAFISVLETEPGPASCDHNTTPFFSSLPQSSKGDNFWTHVCLKTTWKDQLFRGPAASYRGGRFLWSSPPAVQLLFFSYRALNLSRYGPNSLFFLPAVDMYFL